MPTKRRKRAPQRIGGDDAAIVEAFLLGRDPPPWIPADEAFLKLRFWKNSDEGLRVMAELDDPREARGRRTR